MNNEIQVKIEVASKAQTKESIVCKTKTHKVEWEERPQKASRKGK